MGQITTGFRSLLSSSLAYDILQDLLGARRSRQRLIREYIRPNAGETIIDVGCGTCAILELLPAGIDYVGFDLSPNYIAAAKERFGERGTFYCRDISTIEATELPPADCALAIGLLHHLDDDAVRGLMQAIAGRLRTGARLITVDPCFEPSQSRIARYLISRDRGTNVRTGPQYAELATPFFGQVELHVRHDFGRIPYTHAILECRK
jgi:SAM-dependent methyltransferase